MKKTIIPLMLLMVLALVGIVNGATATFEKPNSTIARVAGTFPFNITTNLNVTSEIPNNGANCTVTATSATAQNNNSFTFYLFNDSKDSVTTNSFSGDIYTVRASDASDWLLSASCTNGSDTATTTLTIAIDNSIPTCDALSFSSNTKYYINNNTFIVQAIIPNATTVTAYFDEHSYTLSNSGNDNVTVYDYNIYTLPKGTYRSVYVSATDGRNTSTCGNLTYVTFDSTRGGTKQTTINVEKAKELTGKITNKTTMIVLFLAIGVIVLFAISSGKKR